MTETKSLFLLCTECLNLRTGPNTLHILPSFAERPKAPSALLECVQMHESQSHIFPAATRPRVLFCKRHTDGEGCVLCRQLSEMQLALLVLQYHVSIPLILEWGVPSGFLRSHREHHVVQTRHGDAPHCTRGFHHVLHRSSQQRQPKRQQAEKQSTRLKPPTTTKEAPKTTTNTTTTAHCSSSPNVSQC